MASLGAICYGHAGRYQWQPHLELIGPLGIAGLDRPELSERPLLGVLRDIASTALHDGRVGAGRSHQVAENERRGKLEQGHLNA